MPGEGVVRPAPEVQWLQAGVAPVFGNKKQGETCKANEECAPGFLCSKVTNIESRSAQCRKICNTAAHCSTMTCSMFSELLDFSFTVSNSSDASYGVCFGAGEL